MKTPQAPHPAGTKFFLPSFATNSAFKWPAMTTIAKQMHSAAGIRENEVCSQGDRKCIRSTNYPGCIEVSSKKAGYTVVYHVERKEFVA